MTARPDLDGIYGATANPLRLVYLMGMVWRLAQSAAGASLDVLEVGSWCGASALVWGEAIQLYYGGRGRLTCVDPWEPYSEQARDPTAAQRLMDEALASGEPYRVFIANMRFLPSTVGLDVLRGRSSEVLPTLAPASFDLVYLDGDHAYAAISADIAHAMPLLREDGILCGDDLEIQAHDCDPALLARVKEKERAQDDQRRMDFHPGVTRAVAELLGPVSNWHGFWAMQKSANGWRPVSLDGMPARIPASLPAASLIGLKAALMEKGIL